MPYTCDIDQKPIRREVIPSKILPIEDIIVHLFSKKKKQEENNS